MTCQDCAKPYTHNLHCTQCCARLVASARPSRSQQEAMLAAIARLGSPLNPVPTRAAILEAM